VGELVVWRRTVYSHLKRHSRRQSGRQGLWGAMDTSSLLWGLLFGSIGLGFLVYGRKQKKIVPLVCGIALMIFPYFVSNTILLVALGVVLISIPYFVRM
jgi:CHASE2 domain-containing sensor protein